MLHGKYFNENYKTILNKSANKEAGEINKEVRLIGYLNSAMLCVRFANRKVHQLLFKVKKKIVT